MSTAHIGFEIKPLRPGLAPIAQSTDGSAGFDISMPASGSIPARGRAKVGLGFAAAIPAGHVALIIPRSGVDSRDTIELENSTGIMGPGHSGEWVATLMDKTGEEFSWVKGQRFLQMFVVSIQRLKQAHAMR